MNRVDFMDQLESLLQSISSTEREEAIQYYNDYFDDAGAENEQEVIEALGNPARVAENIKRDLAGSGYGEGVARKVKASDRALMEYGKEISEDAGNSGKTGNTSGTGTSGGWNQAGFGNGTSDSWNQNTSGYTSYTPEKHKKGEGMPAWAIALLVTILVIASPVLASVALGIVGTVIGLIAGWFALIFGFGVTAVVLLGVMVALVVIGVLCAFLSPWAGIALVGGGLLCGGLGLLFLMATVAMAGFITPAIFRGIAFIFRSFQKKRAMAH